MKTRKKLLEEALRGLSKYIKQPDADLSKVAEYLIDLAAWIDAPQAESSDPPNPPPPPPGRK